MKLKQNEQGMALITVLLIITIFTILGMSAMSFTMQSNQLRTYSDDEVEGKMLAEMGLLYFQEYLNESLDISLLSNPNQITTIIGKMAALKTGEKEHFKVTHLPDGQGAFAIMYKDPENGTIPYKDDDSVGYTQPYSRKIEVSVIGIPKNAIGDSRKRVIRTRLDATLYINTIPSPFHYAISTPNELRLFGGSNIIGNIEVGNRMLVSNYYKYNIYLNSKDKWDLVDRNTIPNFETNQPYIEGKVFLRNSISNLYYLTSTSFTDNTNNKELPPQPIIADPYSLDRQSLNEILSPRKIEREVGIISTETETPDIPGWEPPFFEKTSTKVVPIPFGDSSSLKDYIHSQFLTANSKPIIINRASKPFALEIGTWSFLENSSDELFIRPNSESFTPPKAIIYSDQDNIYFDEDSPETYLLTARLSSTWLFDNHFKQLFIGPTSDDWNDNATVEMGSTNSFNDPPENEGSAFTFTGPIYIKGNLDIVGNIKVKGTIFVDGDVVIRDMTNLDVNYPLVIMATGKITVSNRASNNPLNAFLYSDGEPIEIYSIDSINRIDGGIAIGNHNPNALIELNTLRKTDEPDLNSRLTIKFDRGIFEKDMPGLPSADQFYIDTYDMVYSNFQGDIE